MSAQRKKLVKHVHKQILMRARIFSVILLIMFGILVRDVFVGTISPQLLLGGVGVGILFGVIASRMFHLSWDKDGKQVVGKLDGIGIAVLIVYILFSVFRGEIVSTVIHGPLVGTVSLAILGGTFLGQIIGIRNGVKGILRDEGILK